MPTYTDLLVSLERVTGLLAAYFGEEGHCQPAIDVARAAIAKATGATPQLLENDVTTATELMHLSAYEAMNRAVAANASMSHDWDHEATLFTFKDGSVLVVSGPLVYAYADIKSAEESLNA